jgi:23S rRNA (uridine2552-2'-O)-methyltransferase
MAKRSKSSANWLQEHHNDPYVAQSKKEGYRSRAVYKLIEIDEKDKLFKKGMRVVDLGAAPGSWTQYAVEKLGEKGLMIASDILPMDSFSYVEFVEGDFREEDVLNQILEHLGTRKADVVMSDMAPNFSGVKAVDLPSAMYLNELAVDMANQVLKTGGNFVCKVFHREGFEELVRGLRTQYDKVKIRKPKASRPRSKEVYVVALGFKGI